MADIELVIKMSQESYNNLKIGCTQRVNDGEMIEAIKNGTPLTPTILADALMEERIRGKLDSDTTFEKDIIDDVKCRLTVSIRDHRPCYCGAGLKEVWKESKEQKSEDKE